MSTRAERKARREEREARAKTSRIIASKRPRRVPSARAEEYPGQNLDRATREWGVSVRTWSGGLVERNRGKF